jgi:hypothetical protein
MAELREFLSELAVDPKKLGEFIHDPDAAMRSAELSDADRAALKSGFASIIYARLAGVPTEQAFQMLLRPAQPVGQFWAQVPGQWPPGQFWPPVPGQFWAWAPGQFWPPGPAPFLVVVPGQFWPQAPGQWPPGQFWPQAPGQWPPGQFGGWR